MLKNEVVHRGRRGGRPGNANAVKTGAHRAAVLAHQRQVMGFIRESYAFLQTFNVIEE